MLVTTILLVVTLLPLGGCYQLIGIVINSTSSSGDDDYDFELNDISPRSQEVQLAKFDGVADQLLQQEQLPEQKLAAEGLAEKRLAAAGVNAVAADELVGIVVDSNLQPIAGASVDAYHWSPGDVALTNDQGLFRLPGLDPREAPPLLISKAGYSPRMITGHATGQKDLLVILGNQTCLEGLVTDADDKPVPGARIIATCSGIEYRPGHRSGPIPFETTSGADGRYRLGVCANRFDVTVLAGNAGVFQQSGIIVKPNQTHAVPVKLQAGIRFEATVVDSVSGAPVEGFVLYTTSAPRMSARSDEQGRLVFEGMFPGVIEFHCGAGDRLMNGDVEYWKHGQLGRWWSPDALHLNEQYYVQPSFDPEGKKELAWQYNNGMLTYDISQQMPPVKIIVEQGVTITGIVMDPNGMPVSGATVAASLSGRATSPGGGLSVTTDAAGRYRAVLPASHKINYNMVAHDGQPHEWRQWANGISKPFQSKPGQVIEHIDLQLTTPGVIRGRLTHQGKPVADRVVYTQSVDRCDHAHFEPTVRTSADGTFELKFVRPGQHYVLAEPRYSPPSFDPKGYEIVEVKSGDITEGVNLKIKQDE